MNTTAKIISNADVDVMPFDHTTNRNLVPPRQTAGRKDAL